MCLSYAKSLTVSLLRYLAPFLYGLDFISGSGHTYFDTQSLPYLGRPRVNLVPLLSLYHV